MSDDIMMVARCHMFPTAGLLDHSRRAVLARLQHPQQAGQGFGTSSATSAFHQGLQHQHCSLLPLIMGCSTSRAAPPALLPAIKVLQRQRSCLQSAILPDMQGSICTQLHALHLPQPQDAASSAAAYCIHILPHLLSTARH